MKFKIGDKVRCIRIEGISGAPLEHYGWGWKENYEFEIIKISNLDGSESRNGNIVPIYWYRDFLSELGVYEKALELVGIKIIKVSGLVKFLESIERK